MSAGRWSCGGHNRQGAADSQASAHPRSHDRLKANAGACAITPAGLMFLAITSVGWGFNWPVTKYLLSELPPLTMRGSAGVIGALLLAAMALFSGQSLHVPRALWPRLVLAAMLNVALWMALMGLALLWLPASEAALIAYTMPIWASMLAWPVLGERPNLLRVISLVMAFAGLASIMGGNGFAASVDKMAGNRHGARRRRRLCRRHRDGEEAAAQSAAAVGRRLADRDRLFSGRHRRLAGRERRYHQTVQSRLDPACSIRP